jgi:hypothetical protein
MPLLEFSGERPTLQVLLGGFQQFGIAIFPLFGIPKTPFWMYVCALLVLVAGLIRTLPELPREHGLDKIMPFGRLFYAVSMAAFASEHFTLTPVIAGMVPRWIPWHTFWAYAIGTAFFCAALSIATRVQARLAAILFGTTFLVFVLTMDLPAALAHPGNRFFWALALRELAFSGGAFALAMSLSSNLANPVREAHSWLFLPRFQIGAAALFYGIEDVIHPRFVPVVPLKNLTPEWIHGRMFPALLVGVMLIAGGVCFLLRGRSRRIGTALGLTILLAILWVYLPMLVAAPVDVLALNYFFDTLLFCGAVLLLANAMDNETAVEPEECESVGAPR